MITSTTTSAPDASSATSRAYVPLSTQQNARHGNPPVVGIRLPQAGFTMAPITGLAAAADNAPHFTSHLASSSPRSRFCTAVRNGDATAVKKLLEIGQGDVNTIDPATRITVLLLAALHGHDDIVLLLCKGASRRDLHRTDAHGNSALMLAAGAGHADVVTLLLHLGADVDQEDHLGNTALLQLAAHGKTAIAQRLIDAGADPAHLNHAGQTAAELAMAHGHRFFAAALSGITPNALASTGTSTVPGTAASTTAAPNAFLASSTVAGWGDTARVSLQEAIEANDLNALKRALMALRQSGHDVPQHMERLGKLDTSDPFFADQEGTLLMAAAHRGHAKLIPVLLVVGAQIDQALPDGWTALLFAARQGHTAAVRALVAGGANIDQVDAEGDTALIFAARNGDTALVEQLLQAGADKNHRNANGDTALIEATWKGDANTVRALLKAKTDPHQRNDDGMNALMFAARDGHVTIVRMLLQAGAMLDNFDADGTTALMFAAAQGHGDIVGLLLAEDADPDEQDMEGLSALGWAHARAQDAVARLLTRSATKSSSATVSSTSSAVSPRSSQVSPAKLLKAIERNDARALKRMLDALRASGKDVVREVNQLGKLKNPKNPFLTNCELTPLMLAACLGHENLLALLFGAGASINETDEKGRSPLIWAASQSDNGCLNALLKAGAKVDHADADGLTALMVASKNGITASVQTLLNGGAHVDQIGNHGETALKLAASSGHIFILGVLIDAGAMIDMTKFRGGQTALMWAAMAGKTAIVRKLLQAGADPDLKTDLGHKALDYARERRHDDIVELLRTAEKATVKPGKKLFRKLFG